MSGDAAEALTSRRPDRYAAVRRQTAAHAAEHGCGLEALTEVEGRELGVLVRATHSSYVLEIGSGIGYSGLLIAASFGATGRLDTIESDAVHARLAEQAYARYSLAERVRIQGAEGDEVVPALSGPYDLIVLDARWGTYPRLYEDFIRLLRTGGSLSVTPRGAAGANPESDPFLSRLAEDDRLLPWFAPGLARVIATKVR